MKKTIMVILTALLMVAPFAGVVSANDGPPIRDAQERGSRFSIGKIIEIGNADFTVITRKGEFKLLVTDDTVFKTRDGETISFSDLSMDRYVAGNVVRDDEGNLIARVVILLPEDFDPQEIELVRLMGEVEKVNNGQNTFELKTDQDEILTIHVNDRTRYLGNVSELKDLEKGMPVGVGAVRSDEGEILAKVVASKRPEGDRPHGSSMMGLVTAVDANSLTVQGKDGSLTFHVTGNTIFKSRGDVINSLSDISVGMGAMVAYKTNGEGNLQALVIAAGEGHEGKPNVRKAVGEVSSINDEMISIVNKTGESVSFTMDENTKFVSREDGGGDPSLIEIGQTVLIVFTPSEDSNLIAKFVGIGQK